MLFQKKIHLTILNILNKYLPFIKSVYATKGNSIKKQNNQKGLTKAPVEVGTQFKIEINPAITCFYPTMSADILVKICIKYRKFVCIKKNYKKPIKENI